MAATPAPNSRQGRFALAAICIGFFLVLLDTTIVNVALPHIGTDLGGSTSDLQWIVNAYTIPFAALLLSGGALSDRLGARRVYLVSMASFGIASVLCALAPTLGWLIAGRALEGLAAAAMVPSSLSLITHTFPDPTARAHAVGFWIGSAGLAATIGPTLGGILTEYANWRAIFVINIPVVLVGLYLGMKAVPTVAGVRTRAFDIPGQILAAVMLIGLVDGLIATGDHPWSAPEVWVPLVIFVVALGAFLEVERRHRDPVLPLSLFRSGRFSAGCGIGALINLGYYGQLFVLSLYFQDVLGYSAVQAGLAFIPALIGTIPLSIAAGRMTARYGPLRPTVIGLAVGVVGLLLLLVAVGSGVSYWALLPGMVVLSAGALIPAPLSVAVVTAVPQERSGVASGVLNAARQTGGAIGIAILGSLIAANVFVVGMRWALAISAATYLLSLVLAVMFLPRRTRAGSARIRRRLTPAVDGPAQ